MIRTPIDDVLAGGSLGGHGIINAYIHPGQRLKLRAQPRHSHPWRSKQVTVTTHTQDILAGLECRICGSTAGNCEIWE